MALRSILLLVASFVYFIGCHYWFTCRIKQVCYGCAPAAVAESEVVPAGSFPPAREVDNLLFAWSESELMPIANLQFFRSSVLGRQGPGEILEITGRYFAAEINDSNYENVGLARAHEVRKLFADHLAEQEVVLRSKLFDTAEVQTDSLFKAVELYWIPRKANN